MSAYPLLQLWGLDLEQLFVLSNACSAAVLDKLPHRLQAKTVTQCALYVCDGRIPSNLYSCHETYRESHH